MKVDIRKLGHTEKAPMDLLFKADPSVEMIEKYLYSSDCFLVEVEGETAGVFVLHANTQLEIEMKNISIVPSFQSQGIGKEILKYVIRISKLEGYTSLIAKVADISTDALNFYAKLGFEEFFVIKGHYIKYYDQPIIENGKSAKDQIVLRKIL